MEGEYRELKSNNIMSNTYKDCKLIKGRHTKEPIKRYASGLDRSLPMIVYQDRIDLGVVEAPKYTIKK